MEAVWDLEKRYKPWFLHMAGRNW